MSSTIKRILVPTDFSEASELAVEYGAALANQVGASLYLIHVVHDRARYQSARSRLGAISDRLLECSRIALEVRDGDPAESIAEAAMHYGADLIVMATHARTGLAHLLTPSIAERLIRIAVCPVLVLRDTETVRIDFPEAAFDEAGELEGVA
jgi:nucleotide-binding universal stress UspA family protein